MEKIKQIKSIDWDKVPVGTEFKAIIDGKKCKGKIQKEDGNIYLCQNKCFGAEPEDLLGYDGSWQISVYPEQLLQYDITNLEIIGVDLEYEELTITNIGYHTVQIGSDSIQVGCQTVSLEEVEEIYNEMKRLREKEKLDKTFGE